MPVKEGREALPEEPPGCACPHAGGATQGTRERPNRTIKPNRAACDTGTPPQLSGVDILIGRGRGMLVVLILWHAPQVYSRRSGANQDSPVAGECQRLHSRPVSSR